MQDVRYFFSYEASLIRGREVDKAWEDLLVPPCAREGKCMMGIMYPAGMGSGLGASSAGLRQLFASGSIRNQPIINIRNTLTQNGFTQTLSNNKQGYLFRLVQELHLTNALTLAMLSSPESLNWGINEVAVVKLLDSDTPLRNERTHPDFHQVAFLWEGERRIDVVFQELEIILRE